MSVQTSLFLCLLRSCRMKQCRSAFVRGHLCLYSVSRIIEEESFLSLSFTETNSAETTDLFLTRQRMTHSASWMERSASSITSLLEPRTTMLTVFPGLAQPVICTERQQTFTGSMTTQCLDILYSGFQCFQDKCDASLRAAVISVQTLRLMRTLTSFPEPSRLTSSTSSAVPSISAVKWSMWAMGLVPIVWKRGETLF